MDALSDIKITIGMTTYNRPEFLREAVQSVLQQSYKNFELIISNDFIERAVIFEDLGIENDSRIKIINQVQSLGHNLGDIKNMNFLLEIAQSEWFVWLADDDLMHPDFLKHARETIMQNQEKNVVGFFSNYISASSPADLFPPQLGLNKPICYRALDFLLDYSSRKCSLIGCSGVIRTTTLRRIGGIPQLGNSFGPYGDTLLPILLIEYGNIFWLDEPLIFFRTHAESISCKSIEFSAYTSAESDFLDQIIRICSTKKLTESRDKIIANMTRWFSQNEWVVLSRISTVTGIVKMKIFLKYQLAVNLTRLSFKYKINHIHFVARMVIIKLLSNCYQKLKSATL